MSEKPRPAPLTFPDADRSPLSIRAKALVFFDPRSHRVAKNSSASRRRASRC